MTGSGRVVVVGASIGGLTAAETLRQEGYDGEIVLVGDEPHLPYNRPPLSKQILMWEWEPEQARVRTAAEIDDLGVQLRMGCPATGLDVAARVLNTARGPIEFDELVIATGSSPRRHSGLPSAPTLRTVADALALRDALRAASSVVVVGSGVLGSEIASAACKHGVATTIAGLEGALGLGGVGTLLSDRLADLHRAHDVELLLRSAVVDSEPATVGTQVVFADGGVRRFDLVVAMIGATPNTQWLEGSSLPLGDGVLCDSAGAAAAPGVHAVGDVAAWLDPMSGLHVRVEHQSNAIEQAIAVAIRIVHGTTSERPVPMFWSEVHRTRINAYGWFDPALPLVGDVPDAAVLTSSDAEGHVRGVVGWDASPREFRAARACVFTVPARPPVLTEGTRS